MKKILVLLFLLFIISVSALLYVSREFLLPREPVKQTIRVIISRGMGASEVARVLEDRKVIRHAWSFHLLSRLTKTSGKIVAGTYDLSPSNSEYEILRILVRGEGILARITIPEGFDLRQIARALDAGGVVSKKAFWNAAHIASFEIPDLLKTKGVEGFLFPDTYNLEPDISPASAMKPMLERFGELVVPLYKKANPKQTLFEIVTLASMIEREGKIAREYPIIASVYYNRLHVNMPLQCDATIQYLLPAPKENLSARDMKIDSPYNTYRYRGLPPGPIGSPGLAAINAAILPAHTKYLYYVLMDSQGHHTFSATYQEHLRAVAKYRKYRRENDEKMMRRR